MSYLGKPLSGYDTNLDIRFDVFNGNASNTEFTLTYAVNHVKDIEVLVDNVQQSPFSGAYSVSGQTLTFSSPPASGSNNVYIIYRDYFQVTPPSNISTIITDYIAPQAVTNEKLGNYAVTSLKVSNTISLANLTITGPSVSQNTFSLNTRATSANHATQKQYVDALTIVFGA